MEALNGLLDEILNNDVALDRDELHCRLARLLPHSLSFTFILVERRRFSRSDNDVATEKIYLPFLSFKCSGGSISTFDNPTSVADVVARAKLENSIIWQKPKAILIAKSLTPEEIDTVRTVEKIMLSYYYACGHYEHFMNNASRRFAINFFSKDHESKMTAVIDAIDGMTDSHAAYVIFDQITYAVEVVYDPNGIYSKLQEHITFRKDLTGAVANKRTFSGRTPAGQNYVVSVATLDRSYQLLSDVREPRAQTVGNFGKRHVLILAAPNGSIPMDVVKFGPDLFKRHLDDEGFTARERLIFKLYRSVSEIERLFIGQPPSTRTEVDDIIVQQLEQILDSAIYVTAADLLVVRLSDPFSGHLRAVAGVSKGQVLGTATIKRIDAEITSDALSAFADGTPKTVTAIPSYASSIKTRKNIVGYIFPLEVGLLTRGIVEIYSGRSTRLRNDEEYLNAIAEAIGDAIRRIEGAADMAWLSRLSFLHSARHEIENFLPILAERDKALHSSLRTTLERYSGVGQTPWRPDLRPLAEQAFELFEKAQGDRRAVDILREQVEMVEDVFEPGVGFRFVFSEVLSTLVANAKKHTILRAEDFSVDFDQCDRRRSLSITYQTGEKRISAERALSVATAPIPDRQSTTFHYGLFLAAAQVRMNGGSVFVQTDFPVELNTIPFKIRFVIPLDVLGDSYAD